MAPETRSRTSKRRKIAYNDLDKGDALVSADKSQVSTRKGRKKGKLSWIPALPLDVLFEVLYYLKFDEMLRLSRLNKALRTILLHESSVSVWRIARNNSGLPPAPLWAHKPLNEPQWASLWFDAQCSQCGAKVKDVRWTWCIRLCKTCAPVLLMGSKDAFYLEKETMVSTAILSMIGVEDTEEEEFLISEFLGNRKRVFSYARVFASMSPGSRKWFSDYLEKIVTDRNDTVELLKTLFNSIAKERIDQLQDMRLQRRNSTLERLSMLGWDEEIVLMTSWEHEKMEKMKELNKPQHLTDRIWKNISETLVAHMEKVKSRRIEREAWNLTMSRPQTAQEVFRAYKFPRFAKTGAGDSTLFPEIYDFCSMAPVQALIDVSHDTEIPKESFEAIPVAELVEKWRNKVYYEILGMVRENITQAPPLPVPATNSEDVIMWNVEDSDSEAQLDDGRVLQQLMLATTVFTCKCCGGCMSHSHVGESIGGQKMYSHHIWDRDLRNEGRPLFFPQVMGHRCLTRTAQKSYGRTSRQPPSYEWGASYMDDFAAKVGDSFQERYHWRTDYLCLDAGMSTLARGLVECAGLNPSTATAADMDALDLAFSCSECFVGGTDIEGPTKEHWLGWRRAVCMHFVQKANLWNSFPFCAGIQHVVQEHSESSENLWWVARSSTELKQDFATSRNVETAEKLWKCLHCVDEVQETRPQIVSHISSHIHIRHTRKKRLVIGRDVQEVYMQPPVHTEEKISVVRPRFQEIQRPRCRIYVH